MTGSTGPLGLPREDTRMFHEGSASEEEPYRLDTAVLELSHTHTPLTNVPGNRVAAFYLLASYDVPDTSHPVSEQSKHRHEQGQNHGAVLGVAIQFLQQTQQT